MYIHLPGKSGHLDNQDSLAPRSAFLSGLLYLAAAVSKGHLSGELQATVLMLTAVL